MKFLYKTDDGKLVFQGFTVTVYDGDPDAEEFINGNYKNYDIDYNVPPVQFRASVRSSLFSKKYTIEKAIYDDPPYYFSILSPIRGKPAKFFIENFETILENPKNIYLLPYVHIIGKNFSVDNIPYRAYYTDEEYILGHGFFESLFITRKKSYLETYPVDLEIYLGEKDVVSLFNGIFQCKDHKCVISHFGSKVRIINTKRILTRDLYDIVMNRKVYAFINEEDTYYFLVKTPDGKIMRFYTNPDTELIFRIEPEDGRKDSVNVEIKYYDFIETLKEGEENEEVPERV